MPGDILGTKQTKLELPIEMHEGDSDFYALAGRFASDEHPQEGLNDYHTLVAVGNAERVLIFSVGTKTSQLLKEIAAPKYFSSLEAEATTRLTGYYPTMFWGFGHSPMFTKKQT